MKYLVWSLLLLLIVGELFAQVAPKVKQIHLEYKSPSRSITIKDTSFVITNRKEVYDNPVSSIPSSSTFEDKSYSLTRKEVYNLIKFLQDQNFFELENAYGAPEAERHYPTKIFIKMLGKEKEVIYRSNPSFGSAPDSFQKIERYLNEIRK